MDISNQESAHKLLDPSCVILIEKKKKKMHVDSNRPRTFALIIPLYMIIVLS